MNLEQTNDTADAKIVKYRQALKTGEILPELKKVTNKKAKLKKNWFFLITIAIGLGMLLMAAQPLIKLIWSGFWQSQGQAVYPVSIDEFIAKIDNNPKILGDFTQVATHKPVMMDDLVDYSNLENWLGIGQHAQAQTEESYLLEINKLGIKNALVKIGGNNIDHNLVQFNPEAKIGNYGAPVIFGHSILRQFYNPKETNKDRYKSIFSTIMTLEKGDEIKVHVGALTYTYEVTERKEVAPEADYIMEQKQNLKQIKLITCTPEGTYLRRGVITAELKQ